MNRDPKTPGGLIAVVAGSLIGGLTGLAVGGFVTALVGILGGCLLATVAVVAVRARRIGHVLSDRDAPSLSGLTPDQALAVVGAASQAPGLQSALLRELRELEERSMPDEQRVEALRRLQDQNPRSPLVAAALARAEAATGRADQARRAAHKAVILALDGGMNPAAAGLYAEFFRAGDGLELSAQDGTRLGAALEAMGEPELARRVGPEKGSA